MEIQWSLLLFSLLAGTGGSILALVSVSELSGIAPKSRKALVILALALVIVGGLFSVTHLEQKAHIMAAAANILSFSAISLELIFVGLVAIMAVVYLVGIVRGLSAGAMKVIAVVSLVVGLLLGYVTGSGYQMGAQPLWNTPMLPLAYLGTDLALAAAVYGAVTVGAKDAGEAASKRCALYCVIGAAASLVFCLIYGVMSGAAMEPALFWGGVIVLGGIANMACAVAALKKADCVGIYVAACVFALIAGVCLRAFMWLVGTGTLDFFAAAADRLVL